MTTDNKAPREFWIVEENGFFSQRIALNEQPKNSDLGRYDKLFHVIEKSHADNLQLRLEKCEALLRELNKQGLFEAETQDKVNEYFKEK